MEDNFDNVKILYTKNLEKVNLNQVINIPIDSNVTIKDVLEVKCCICDEKIECASGKALYTGKLNVRVLYLDTDNMTNIVTDSQNITGSFVDPSISTDSCALIKNKNVVSNVLNKDTLLKINCDVTLTPSIYLNLSMKNTSINLENMVCKKTDLKVVTLSNVIDTDFNHSINLETSNNVSKILTSNSMVNLNSIETNDGYFTIEGNISTSVIYETDKDGELMIEELSDTERFKTDITNPNITKSSILDIVLSLDDTNDNISKENDDENNIITITNKILVKGIESRESSIDTIVDLFSTQNEIETSFIKRETLTNSNLCFFDENVSNETTLNEDEPAIDKIISNSCINTEVTNTYFKNDTFTIEGVVSSNIIYIDENKKCRSKLAEIPFVVNLNIDATENPLISVTPNVCDYKIRVKRGTIIELDYSLRFNVSIYNKQEQEILDNIKIGKGFDFSNYDYQIFIAKPEETLWDLSKRIKILPDDLTNLNPNLPSIMQGGERIIIKR